MGGIPRSILLGVSAILGLCAVGGFAMGLVSTLSHKVASADEEAPIASNVAANVTIKDAQPLAPPPPPAPPKPKPAVVADAASDQPPADAAAKIAATPGEATAAPPPLAIPPLTKPAPARLPDDLPPT
ncbi:MAG: hypothetical protein JWO72_1119 [Caulobacteraceae bacterium]|nr:hypothetical protein [Caulobacteraceae bacterium]